MASEDSAFSTVMGGGSRSASPGKQQSCVSHLHDNVIRKL